MDTYFKISSHCPKCGDKVKVQKFVDKIFSDKIYGGPHSIPCCCPNFCGEFIVEICSLTQCPKNAAFIWSEEEIV
jgi:hypothetical protein